MSQVITNAFEQYWQSSLAAEQPVVLDEFVLADIPNLDITAPIDPDTGLPPQSQIVHRQTVDQRGRVNSNAVAYSIVMDTTLGDFSFNAMFLRNKANGVIGMIVYKGRETKLKTDQTTGQTGNSLVKSMLMGYDQAAEATLTHVDAGTWQIDYAARLRGQDEDLRQLASQLYGHHTFIGDGFKVVQQDGAHQVTSGVAIVGGLRVELKQPEVIYPGIKPIGVWVDVHRSGSLLSEHQNHFTIITSVADLTDHVDGNGYQHYVAKLGTVQADCTVVDGRGGTGGTPDTFALWKRSMAEAGYDLVGQFGIANIITAANQVILNRDGSEVFAWRGALNKEIYADSTPESTGGISTLAWESINKVENRRKLSMYGARVGADNTNVLQAAMADLSGSGRELDVDGQYTFTGTVQCDNVYLVGAGSLSGSGKLIGVLSNETVPYEIIHCWNNVVTRSQRSTLAASADIVVDPLLGSDSSTTYVSTLQRAINLISELVAASPTRDYTIALRAGRCELGTNLILPANLNGWGGTVDDIFSTSQLKFTDLTINADSTARYGVRIAPYPGEDPVVCPPTKWFFPCMAAGGYKKHAVVPNHTGVRFFKLFGADGLERQCAGSWNRRTHALHRNQNRNVTIAGTSPNITHSIRLPLALQEIVGVASTAELAAIRVRITQWFTASWHVENMTLADDVLSFKGYTADNAYADGWAYINADAYGAPFFIENLKAFITRDDEFTSTATEVVLPRDDVAFFTTTPLTYAALLGFNGTKNVTIEAGISVRYVTGNPVQVASGTWGVKNNPFAAIQLGDYGAAYSPELYGVESDGIKLSKVGSLVKAATASKIGGNTITHVDGAHYSIVRGCIIEDHAQEQVGAFGICVTGKEIELSGNRVTDGGFSALRCDSAAFLTDQSFGTVMSGAIFNNLALSVGMRDGKLSERYPTGDTGVMTINGRGPVTNYAVYSNVFGDCVGAGGSRALFLDDGVNGTCIHHNVLFGAQDYSLDARQVGGNTRNNQVHNNLLVGNARLYDVSNGSLFSNNILFGNYDFSEDIAQDGNNIVSQDNPIICHQGDGFIKTNVPVSTLKSVLTDFTKPFVRKLSFMGI